MQLASKSSCHAIRRLTNIANAGRALHFQGASRGGGAGRVALETGRRRVWASRSMEDNLPDPHKLCSWLSPRLTVSRVGLKALGETLASLLVRKSFHERKKERLRLPSPAACIKESWSRAPNWDTAMTTQSFLCLCSFSSLFYTKHCESSSSSSSSSSIKNNNNNKSSSSTTTTTTTPASPPHHPCRSAPLPWPPLSRQVLKLKQVLDQALPPSFCQVSAWATAAPQVRTPTWAPRICVSDLAVCRSLGRGA
eukprot:1160911-Pelagomonas_calceolata.AAC.6